MVNKKINFNKFKNSIKKVVNGEKIDNDIDQTLEIYFNQRRYLKQKRYFSSDFIKILSNNSPKLLIKYIKRSKSFLKEDHFKIFTEIFENHIDKDIKQFYKEIKYFKNILKEGNRDIKDNFDPLLKDIEIKELLIHLALYYEKVRIDDSDFNLEFMINKTNIIKVFNIVLNKKLKIDKKINKNITDIELIKDMDNTILGNLINSDIYDMIKGYDILEEIIFLIDLYCFNNWEVQFLTDKEIKLKPKDGKKDYIDKKLNDKKDIRYPKSELKEIYFNLLNNLYQFSDLKYLKPIDDIEGDLNYLDKITHFIKDNLLHVKDLDITPLIVRKKDYLIDSSLQTGATPEQIIEVYNFFSNDITAIDPKKIDLSVKPLIKLNSLYIWFPAILNNKNYNSELSFDIDKLSKKQLKLDGYKINYL